MKIVILGPPRTKKNSQRILRGRSGAPFVAQSAQHDAWAKSAILQARMAWKSQGLVGTWQTPANLCALVYRERRTGDLGNYLAAVCDVLERAGVVENDRLIEGFDGSRLLVDAKNPRVEVYLTPMGSGNVPLYVESLRDDVKRGAELLEEYARHDVTCSCLGCGAPWGAECSADCKVRAFIRRAETT